MGINIKIIAVGKLKERYWREAVQEYSKRMGSYCNLSIIEVKEGRLPDKVNPILDARARQDEAEAILKHIKAEDYVITLEVRGKALSSEELAKHVDRIVEIDGKTSLVFIIGGSTGLDQVVSQRSNFKLSFSNMTFPHQMMRVILLEQIYRVFKINRGETYHK